MNEEKENIQMSEAVDEIATFDAIEEENFPNEIVFTSETGVRYRLGFDRESAMRAEKLYDLSLTEVSSGKASVIQNLFYAAFLKHHPNAKHREVQRLWDRLENKQELYRELVVMYGNTAGSVLEEPEEGKGISWKTV